MIMGRSSPNKMNTARRYLVWFGWLILAVSGRAHRAEGVLQSALVEVQTNQIQIEMSIELGIDSARMLVEELDINHDGIWNEPESATWADSVLEDVTIHLDSVALNPRLVRFQASPFSEFQSGHAEIKVQFSAEIPSMTNSLQTHTIAVRNAYAFKSRTSSYQIHGVVPKAPGVRIAGHSRDASQQAITLQAVFHNPSTVAPVRPSPRTTDEPSESKAR